MNHDRVQLLEQYASLNKHAI